MFAPAQRICGTGVRVHDTLRRYCQVASCTAYKAAVLKEFKKPLVIETRTRSKVLDPKQIRIGVRYCSLNFVDAHIVAGRDPKPTLPFVPGFEFSGEIIELGKKCSGNLKIGDNVVALKDCLRNDGGLSAEAVIDELDCFSIESVPLKDAAILLEGHGTAMLAFSKYCPIKENDVVLVSAGPGGLGLAAIELASSVFKAKVIAICDTEASTELVRDEGAYQAICIKEGYKKIYKFLVDALDGKRQARLAYDAVGQGVLHVLADFVDPENGSLISVYPFFDVERFKKNKPDFEMPKNAKKLIKHTVAAAAAGDDNADNVNTIADRIVHVNLHRLRDEDPEFYRQIVADTLTLCEDDLISAYVSKVYGIEQLQEAFQFLNDKQCTGKVLVEVTKKSKKSLK